MSLISSRRFTVESDNALEYAPRAARRLILNADVLKSNKVCAGDIVAISNGSKLLKVGPAQSFTAFIYLV